MLASLENKRIPASFSSAPLEDVLEFIAAVGNLNVDVDWDALSNIGINRDTEVTLNLRPVPMRVVLDRVLAHARLRRSQGVLEVSTIAGIVAGLGSQYQTTPSRSILRPAA